MERGLSVPFKLLRKKHSVFKVAKREIKWSTEFQKRAVTHSGDRKMDSSVEAVGAERARAHSLTRESWDALVSGTVELTSILTCPRLTGVAPTYAFT